MLFRYRILSFYLVAWVSGAAVGVFFLFPVNEFVYYYEHAPDAPSASHFVLEQMRNSLSGKRPGIIIFYALIGAALGLLAAVIYRTMHERFLSIQKLSAELGKDIDALISQGEGPVLEFKSSLRWDFKLSKVNRRLELAVVKTLAGFMNGEGGTLLIGVSDKGEIVGLEKDYQSLRRQDRDGFEQAVTVAVATNLGADVCRLNRTIFQAIDGKDVCRVITSSASRPVFLKSGNDKKFFVRTGGSTRELDIEEALEYISSRWKK